MERLTYTNGNEYIYFIIDGYKVRINDVDVLRVAERLKHYEDLEEQGKLVFMPCKEGDTVYKIVKFCEANDGYKEFYRPSVEFKDDCEYLEPQYWADDCERCNAQIEDDDKEPWYCSLNLDILCEKCKERFAIQKDKFTFSKVRQVFNTPMFNENTSLEDIYYLSFEEADNALKKIIGT